jgi:mycofactocin system transcriptional regulator
VAFTLFREQGFEATSIDDVAAAAGIARRTFFRYFPSKNDIVWGDFDHGLLELERRLNSLDVHTPLLPGLSAAVQAFNRFEPAEEPRHRERMGLVLRVPALQASSTLRYASWRSVVARYAAARLGRPVDALLPQVVGHSCLGAALAAYEQWLARPGSDLPALLGESMSALSGEWCAS